MYSTVKPSLLLAIALIIGSGSAPATITPPISIGQANSTVPGTTLSVPVAVGGVPFGSTIIVSFTMQPNTWDAVTVTDGKNDYLQDAQAYNTSIRTLVFSASVTNALTSSDTITVTCASPSSKAVIIYYVGGLVFPSGFRDKTGKADGSSSVASSGSSGTRSQSHELCWGAIGYGNSSSFTRNDGFTTLLPTTAGSVATIQPVYLIATGTASDSASGNLGASAAWAGVIVTYREDVTPPTISSVTPPANGSYRAGQNLNFTVNFSEIVMVSGAPYISLTIGGVNTKRASYVSGSGSSALVFSYTVAAGDTDNDGIGITTASVNLNSGTIQDLVGFNATTLGFTAPSLTSVRVDTTAPTTPTVAVPANSAYNAGTVPGTFSGSVADDASGEGLNANSTTYTLRNPSGLYWNRSAWQADPFPLGTAHSARAGNTPASWTSSASMPPWASQANGTYTVQATANDKAGNTSTGTPVSFILDTAAPSATITYSPSQEAYKQGTLVTITATFGEPLADSPGVEVAISPVPGGSALPATSMTKVDSTHYTYVYTMQLGNGTASMNMSVGADIAGNVVNGTPNSGGNFNVDNTVPATASVTAPATTGYTAAEVPPIFSGNAADSTGGAGLNADSTTVILQRVSDSKYWTGAAWQSGVANLPTTHSATSGNTAVSWSNSGALPTWSAQNPGSYVVQATATDKAGNAYTGTAATFVLLDPALATATTASSASTTYSNSGQSVLLSATVTSGAGTVNVGEVAFTVMEGAAVIGEATKGTVSGGRASVSYALPANQAAKAYTIQANYHDSAGNFSDSSDSTHQLTVLTALSKGGTGGTLPGFTAATILLTFITKGDDGAPLSTNVVEVATTDGGQSFSFTVGLPSGTKTISIKPRGYLRKRFAVSVTGNQETLDLDETSFVGGDADNDNVVNGTDYAWIRALWGKGSPQYDVNGDGMIDAKDFPDLNGDGVIDPRDYNILKSGWYQAGDPE